MFKRILIFILICLLVLVVSWFVVVVLVRLIMFCFGLKISLLAATGVWLVLCLLFMFIRSFKK